METDRLEQPRLVPGTTFLEEAGYHIILHPTRPVWAVVNATARHILALCDGSRSTEAIAERLSATYRVERPRVSADIRRLVSHLSTLGFFEDGPQSSEKKDQTLLSLFLHLTYRCNLGCAHCYTADKSEGLAEMSTERIKGLLDELADMGGLGVTISGGEPFLRDDCLELIAHASRRLAVRILTNGTLIGEREARSLAELGARVQVSVEGPDAEVHDAIRGPGTFAQAMEGVERLRRAGCGPRLNLCATITSRNLATLPDMIGLAHRLEIPQVRYLPLRMEGRAKETRQALCADLTSEDYARFFRFLFRERPGEPLGVDVSPGLSGLMLHTPVRGELEQWCSIGRQLVITPYGEVYPCVLFMEEPYLLGNIRESSLANAAGALSHRDLYERCLKRRETIAECRDCSWRNLCQGGCPGLPLAEHGTLEATDPFCELRKELFPELMIRAARRKDSTDADGEVPHAC